MPIRIIPLLSIVLMGLLQACSSYAPPTSGKLARIQFLGNQYYVYIDEGNSCGTRQRVTKESWPGTPIRAGRRIWIEQGIDLSGVSYGAECGLAYSFEVEEGQSYVAEFVREQGQCRVALHRVAYGVRAEVPVVRESPKKCF